MTTVLLIRHGDHDWLGHTLVGRTPGIHLNEHGWNQARAVAKWAEVYPVEAIFTSPILRAVQTAEPLGQRFHLNPETHLSFNEIDFGEWMNCRFDELEGDPLWTKWNTYRSAVRVPGGETMAEVQTRALAGLRTLQNYHCVAVVSHGDVIKAMVAETLGFTLNELHQFEISTGGVTILEIEHGRTTILALNQRPPLSEIFPRACAA